MVFQLAENHTFLNPLDVTVRKLAEIRRMCPIQLHDEIPAFTIRTCEHGTVRAIYALSYQMTMNTLTETRSPSAVYHLIWLLLFATFVAACAPTEPEISAASNLMTESEADTTETESTALTQADEPATLTPETTIVPTNEATATQLSATETLPPTSTATTMPTSEPTPSETPEPTPSNTPEPESREVALSGGTDKSTVVDESVTVSAETIQKVTPLPATQLPPTGIPTEAPAQRESVRVPAKLEGLMSQILDDAVVQSGTAREAIAITLIESVVWRDGALGCPEPGMMYTQALVDGYRILLDASGKTMTYHTSGGDYFVYCNPTKTKPQQPLPPSSGGSSDS